MPMIKTVKKMKSYHINIQLYKYTLYIIKNLNWKFEFEFKLNALKVNGG